MDFFYWPVYLSRRRGGDGVDSVILASWNYHFIRIHANLVQHPSNYISNNGFASYGCCNTCFPFKCGNIKLPNIKSLQTNKDKNVV